MLKALKRNIPMEKSNVLRPAVVMALGEDNFLLVRTDADGGSWEGWAMPMADTPIAAQVGDTVLVAGEDVAGCYVLGLLKRSATAHREPVAITTRQGAAAQIVEQEGEQVVQVRDPEDRVLFSYHPQTGKCVLNVAVGDMVLQAPEGNIDLHAGKSVRFNGAEQISMVGGQAVTLGTSGAPDQLKTSIRLGPGHLDLGSRNFSLAAQQADLRVGNGRYQGRAFSATVKNVKIIADRLETIAGRMVQRARDLCAFVQDLHQLKAGRSRTLVRGAYHLKGRRTYLKAEQDVKIDGRKIDLG